MGIEALPEDLRQLILSIGIKDLFPVQEKAIEAGLLEGKSIVVSSPTGSGKSLVALLAAVAALTKMPGCKAVYAAPLRSLVYERAAEWKKILGDIGLRVAVSTGDYDKVEPWLGEADAIMVTYEKLDSLIRHGAHWLPRACLLVVDEIHYVADTKRGPVLETVIARLSDIVGSLQIVALSATIANADEIANWLGARLVRDNWRPVPLREGVFNNYIIYWDDGEETSVEKRTGTPSLDAALEMVAQGGQAIVFTQSRRKTLDLAEKLLRIVEARQDLQKLLDPPDSVEAYVEQLLSRTEHVELNTRLAKLLRRGIGIHHAGLASYQRDVVERAFRERTIYVIFATPTLAAGVNLPARRVVVDSLYRYSKGSSQPIDVMEYKQLAGRAGRPGLDEQGEAVIIARNSNQAWSFLFKYVRGSPEPIVSKLVSEASMRSQVLAVLAGLGEASIDNVISVFEKTLYAKQFGSPAKAVEKTLTELEIYGFVEELRPGYYAATPIGKRVVELYVDPLTAHRIVKGLSTIHEPEHYVLETLFLILWNPDAVHLRPPRSLHLELEAEAEDMLNELGFEYPSDYTEMDVAVAAKALYTAQALLDWINEVHEDAILSQYGADPGDLRTVVETASWLAYSASQLARLQAHPGAVFLEDLSQMIKHGVRRELLELVKLPGIGRVRARILYEKGYTSPDEVAKLSPEQLASLLRGLGEQRARLALEKAHQITTANRDTRDKSSDKRRKTLFDYMGG
jgi:helicase